MVYFLWKEHRAEFGKFCKAVCDRDDNTIMSEADRLAEFENIFGRLDEKWVEGYNTFVDGLQLKKSLLPLGETLNEKRGGSQKPPEQKKSNPGGGGRRY